MNALRWIKAAFVRLLGLDKIDIFPKDDAYEHLTFPSKTDNTQNIEPGWLKLKFTDATDEAGVHRLFDPEIKAEIDPHDYVVKRAEPYFGDTIKRGSGAVLQDANGENHTLTMAYRASRPSACTSCPCGSACSSTKQHDYTEAGTTITRIGGYSSAKLVAAAISLKEWWVAPPRYNLVAEIKNENIASLKTYKNGLHWEEVDNDTDSENISIACDTTLGPEVEPSTEQTTGDTPKAHWYKFTEDTVQKSASTILKFMDRGELINKRLGHHIELDLTALDDVGLTRERLEAMAMGVTNRIVLNSYGPQHNGPALS